MRMIRSEKLYRYAAEFIEGELKAIDKALTRTNSEERREERRRVEKEERRKRHAELRT